jgi:hypothetical protein
MWKLSASRQLTLARESEGLDSFFLCNDADSCDSVNCYHFVVVLFVLFCVN